MTLPEHCMAMVFYFLSPLARFWHRRSHMPGAVSGEPGQSWSFIREELSSSDLLLCSPYESRPQGACVVVVYSAQFYFMQVLMSTLRKIWS